jgi:acyl-CoA thioesterase-1
MDVTANGKTNHAQLMVSRRWPFNPSRTMPLGTTINLGSLMLLLCATSILAAEPGAAISARPSPLNEDPSLPRVMIIGDSISVGYTDAVRDQLAGKANVYRVVGNAGPSSSGVEKVDGWIASADGKWDVVHFNFGLHDIKLGTGGKDNKPYPTSDGHQVPADEYERNLRRIVATLKTTGATLIWCSTTPVPAGALDPLRRPGDEVKYNAIAQKVMSENGVTVNDLYGCVLSGSPEIQLPSNVHFTKEGSLRLARQVAEAIEVALQSRR